MNQPLPLTMLWESADPTVVLRQRFHFATTTDATHWLRDRIGRAYGLTVHTVDRMVMSSYNLLAWISTSNGPLLAKCCGDPMAHQRLRQRGELVVWLAQMQLPVAPPLVATMGTVQVLCDHLSLHLQPIISGDLLDPTAPAQAQAAGVTLAQLHQALAAYPYARTVATPAPVPSLQTFMESWARQKRAISAAPLLAAQGRSLLEQISQLDATPLATQLVHGDYRAANVLWQEDTIAAVLDFEEVRPGYRVNDLAWAAVHLGTRYHDWGPLPQAVQQTFLESYSGVQPLLPLEETWLPALLAWHSLDLTMQTAPDQPAYQTGLATIAFYLDRLATGKSLR